MCGAIKQPLDRVIRMMLGGGGAGGGEWTTEIGI